MNGSFHLKHSFQKEKKEEKKKEEEEKEESIMKRNINLQSRDFGAMIWEEKQSIDYLNLHLFY